MKRETMLRVESALMTGFYYLPVFIAGGLSIAAICLALAHL